MERHHFRLLNKESSISMLTCVSSCEILINGVDAPELAVLLRASELKHLRVVLQAGENPADTLGPEGWEPHTRQLSNLLRIMQKATKQITCIELDCDEAIHEVVGQLAFASANLRKLHVIGNVTSLTLNSFALACPKLATLRLDGCVICTEPAIPQLKRLELVNPIPHANLIPSLSNFKSCSMVTEISLLGLSITQQGWECLPDGLLSLECIFYERMTSDAKVLPHLNFLKVHSYRNMCNTFNVRDVASYVRLAPSLCSLELVKRAGCTFQPGRTAYVSSSCMEARLAEFVFLESRILAGLVIIGGFHILLYGVYPDYAEYESDSEHDDFNEEAHENAVNQTDEFLQNMGVMQSVSGLLLDVSKTEGARVPHNLATTFPNLTGFGVLARYPVSYNELQHVSKCSGLQHVSLAMTSSCGPPYNLTALSLLCAGLDSVQVHVQKTLTESWTDDVPRQLYLQECLRDSGSRAEMVFYKDPRMYDFDYDGLDE